VYGSVSSSCVEYYHGDDDGCEECGNSLSDSFLPAFLLHPLTLARVCSLLCRDAATHLPFLAFFLSGVDLVLFAFDSDFCSFGLTSACSPLRPLLPSPYSVCCVSCPVCGWVGLVDGSCLGFQECNNPIAKIMVDMSRSASLSDERYNGAFSLCRK
jgi:hypothetical protein